MVLKSGLLVAPVDFLSLIKLWSGHCSTVTTTCITSGCSALKIIRKAELVVKSGLDQK